MKKIILTILTTITILGVNAQGNNLQFNRALFEQISLPLVQLPGNSNSGAISNSAIVIPSNKVWKITSVECEYNYNQVQYVPLNATYVGISKSGFNLFSEIDVGEKILWLPEGTYDLKITSDTYPFDAIVLINGIEFNIVP